MIRAVSNVSLSIEYGEFVAICGRSGSGKSTLMNLLGLLERPDSGKYVLKDRDVAKLSEETRATIRNQDIGFIFQLPALLPRASALENVELPLIYAGVPRAERRRTAKEALDRVGLADRSHHWPNQLSGGEQQRVVIARAMANDPALILADEPTGSLDSNTSNGILSLFNDLHRDGHTISTLSKLPIARCERSRCMMGASSRTQRDQARVRARRPSPWTSPNEFSGEPANRHASPSCE
jgi:putative ABC transport system ATP-binding protein